MADIPDLRPATSDEIAQTLAFALQYDCRRRVRQADSFLARIAGERLVQHLEWSGFVILKKPGAPAQRAPHTKVKRDGT